ncbi:MAG: DUF697 domain-containing protein [Aphanocapsa feldmannii 277cV]|uniref:DUF697 domain-containing protein n=2 Tax=Aphanocapsa feldmannii TaxID=192050 RepID=A0A524RLB8_9CHRO|nr:MAG: DUF697 domain-containing protein [Aphanocapsa feldmannii 288cV]TGG90832.1 MAG: DUF697 domain-containing protein [Aphanocapsa feldmannii 277cV]
MNQRRIALLLVLALLGLMVVAALLNLLRRLLWDLEYIFAGLALPVTLLLLAALGWGAWWFLQQRARGRTGSGHGGQRRVVPGSLGSRSNAVSQRLSGIERDLQAIRDAVLRKALEAERAQVQEELQRGDLVVVIFGAGSSGKTSLIRALLDDMVGKVGAAMGSTDRCTTYRLALRGLRRGIRLVDTPGILESGPAGAEREAVARRQAVAADLLLFLVDGDLRASEMEVLRGLLSLGKRLLLVLNKCDLRGSREVEALLDRLAQRLAGGLEPADILAASASPQSVPLPGGKPHQPASEVEALILRMAAVLRAEGEELIADNILLQSRRLCRDTRTVLDRQRRRDAERIVDRYCWIGAGVIAVTPIPGLDLLGTAAVNAQMVIELGKVYGAALDRERGQELALSVGRTLAGLGLVKGGMALVGAALTAGLPAVLTAKAVQGVSAAWLTRIAGRSFITYFRNDQSWGDGGLEATLQHQFELDRREASLDAFLDLAVRKVVDPLRQQRRRLPPRPGPRGAGGASPDDHPAT